MSLIVITHLLNGEIDPQRGVHWEASLTPFLPLIDSLQHEGLRMAPPVIINDCLDPLLQCGHRVENTGVNVYVQRHEHSLHYLMEHPEVEFVWCVDGSDVVMLRPPWEHMRKGILYLGSEESTVGNPWMYKNHPSPETTWFIDEHKDLPLYNAGLIGGDRETVMVFLADVLERWYRGGQYGDKGDMGVVNHAAYLFDKPIVTGPQVHTKFKAYKDNGLAFWKHK